MLEDIPVLMCGTCGKNIDPCKGYFSTKLLENRTDFHIQCRPFFYFQKVIHEAPIEDQRAKEAGL